MNEIKNKDLYINKYSLDELNKNKDNLNFFILLKTQKLSYEFIVNYLKNNELQPEEKIINIFDIIEYQPHLKFLKLKHLLNNI
jgi:hypothetical protein